jgi:malate/lactate dehydrogenase
LSKGRKIAILGAGNVGATIAYTLTASGSPPKSS